MTSLGAFRGKRTLAKTHPKKPQKKRIFLSLNQGQNRRLKNSKKNNPVRISPNLARTFYFAAFPNFFFVGELGNRFRLGDLGGGGRSTQKVIETRTEVAGGSSMSSAGGQAPGSAAGGRAPAVKKPGKCERKVTIGKTTHVLFLLLVLEFQVRGVPHQHNVSGSRPCTHGG